MAGNEKKKAEEVGKIAFVICPIGDGDSPEGNAPIKFLNI